MACGVNNTVLFNFNDLDGVSTENEAWISTHCVSNRLKFGVFVFYLATYGLFIIIFGGLGIMSIRRKKEQRPALMERIIFLCLLGSITNFVKIMLFLNGVYNRWRYIVFPVSLIIIFYMAGAVLKAWVRTLTGLANFGKADKLEEGREDRIFRNFMIYVIISFSILYGIGPIASFSDAWVLNWIFSFGFSNHIIAGMILLSFMHISGSKLLKKLKITQENGQIVKNQEEFKAAILNMKRALFVIKLYFPSMILPSVMAPIWMGVTSTTTNPGMEYSFYMLAFVDELFQMFAFPAFIYSVLYTSFKMVAKRATVKLEEQGVEKRSSSFSYKVEELNPGSE